MTLLLLVSAAAAVGSAARYALDVLIQRRHATSLPWGTFVINVTGSLALGLVTGIGLHHGLGTNWVKVLGIGLLGGYTTWSTFAWETFELGEGGRLGAATANTVGSLAVGLAAAAAGLGLALL